MTRSSVEFYFDFGSPAAYLAWTQLPALCASAGAELVYRPMLLGGVFQAAGNQSPTAVPAKGRYILLDFARHAKRYRVPLVPNPHFPVNTLLLMRGATAMQQHAGGTRFDDYCRAMFHAMWVDAKNMFDPAVVGQVLQAAGFDPAQVLAQANEPAVKERLKNVTEQAVARGVFGAPTMFVGNQMFWGQDRLDFVREALAAG